MPQYQAPRGMNDTLPEDADLWRFIRDTAERVARLFDYRQITTPIVEDAGVFLRSVGDESDIVQKEMYVFEDRGGDRLALRPEGTAAVCRAYIEHGMGSRPQPVRLFYVGPFFRYDRPQAGRYRQLWQFGAEAIGSDSPAIDAELIELQATLYRELGLTDLVLRINSIGTAASRHRYMEALREHFRPHLPTLSKDSQRRFETNVLRILDSKEAQDRAAVAAAPSILDFLDEADTLHFAEVKRALEAAGIEYLVDPFIVRGLDYYTRTVWEFEPASAGGQSTVGAGGRYDALMEILGGPPTPGVGFATGIERMAINLRERGLGPLAVTGPDVYIGVAGREAHGEAIRRARELRLRGQSVVLGDPSRGIGAQKRHAGQLGARDWLVIGNREISTGLTFFRDLETGTDGDTVPLGEMTLAFESMFRKVERLHEAFATARARRAGDGRPADDPLVERWLAAFRTTRNAVVHDDRLPTDDEWDTACQLLDLLRSQLERIEHTP